MKKFILIITIILFNFNAYSKDMSFYCQEEKVLINGKFDKNSDRIREYRFYNSLLEEKIDGEWVSWCTEEYKNIRNEGALKDKPYKISSIDMKNLDYKYQCVQKVNFDEGTGISYLLNEVEMDIDILTRVHKNTFYDVDENQYMDSEIIFSCSSNAEATIKENNSPSITIELLSYEQKTNSYDDTPYCALSYSITNNSWGTLYKIRVKTEAFDDRDTKLDDYGLGGNILNPFSGWFDDQKFISVGDMKQVTNLEFGGQCKYIGTINSLEVKPEDCNIRMMPEDASCLDILQLKSKIDHIKFQLK